MKIDKTAAGSNSHIVNAIEQNREGLQRCWVAGWSVHDELSLPLPLPHLRTILRVTEKNIATINADAIENHAQQNHGARPQCAKGCHHCCFQTIEVTSLDVIAIVLWLEDQPEKADRIATRAQEIAPKVAKLTKPQRYEAGIPCPALDGRDCGVYEARPVACRTYLSMSRSACDRDWARRGKTTRAHWTHIPTMAAPQMAGHSMASGLHAALHATGLELVRCELAAGLAHALAVPDMVSRWLAGERVFAPVALASPAPYGEILEQEITHMVGPTRSLLETAMAGAKR